MASPDRDRAVALDQQLAQVHQELRGRIGRLRRQLGRRPAADDSLRTHCLAFCSALTNHHRGEDAGLFAALLAERPDLAGTVARLTEDHAAMASILTRTAELAEAAVGARGAELAALGRELDGLAAIMESHFRYEERTVAGVRVADTGWSGSVLGLRPPE